MLEEIASFQDCRPQGRRAQSQRALAMTCMLLCDVLEGRLQSAERAMDRLVYELPQGG